MEPPREDGMNSVAEAQRTPAGSFLPGSVRNARGLLAFIGPGYLVAVGYMDPGNWATSIAAGSAFGYALLFVVVASSLMAMLFQSLCARLGLGAGLDLAQACRLHYSPKNSFCLWVLAEVAIVACDMAELIGAAIALKLLFDLPLAVGILLTALDVFLLLALLDRGVRVVEAVVACLVLLIAVAFGYNILLAQPDIAGVLGGLIPRTGLLTDSTMLWLAVGIIGATVMPHNLYLHSALVQSRRPEPDTQSRRRAIHCATADSSFALTIALAINASILILAGAAFHAKGYTSVASLEEAHALLAPLLGGAGAAMAFALALLASGLASTLTGTLAGQIVMEGFLQMRLPPWLRRLATRCLAIIPAMAVTLVYGESGTATLLVASQVVLALQLPFALVPLVRFTTSRAIMGELATPRSVALLAWACAGLIIALNITMLVSLLLNS
jgi:manganese transport protein